MIYVTLAIIAFLFKYLFPAEINFLQTAVVLTGSLIISFIVSAIFYSGFEKSEAKRVQRTLLAIGLKFLLYAVLIGFSMLWFKTLSTRFVVTFFIIYLAFTLYLLLNFVNHLKSKKL